MSTERENSRWLRRRQTDISVDSLESAPFPPPVEDAEAEYLADMAFDDRLLRRLAETSPLIAANFSQTIKAPRDGLIGKYFQENEFIQNEVVIDDDTVEVLTEGAFSFSVEGTLRKLPNSLFVDFGISANDALGTHLHIQSTDNTPDTYLVTCTENEALRGVDIIDTTELFMVICQVGDLFSNLVGNERRALLDAFTNDPSVAQKNIAQLWEQVAETKGTKIAKSTIKRETLTVTNPEHPEHTTLAYEEVEDKDSSKIQLVLTHTTLMPEFDAQESHQLRLIFESMKHETLSQKDAKKIISSGIMQLKSVDAISMSGGRVTQLDLTKSPVVELFVDWFDEVVSDR